jgi:hypothetical protein
MPGRGKPIFLLLMGETISVDASRISHGSGECGIDIATRRNLGEQ